jgi:hypothetical protein
VVDEVISALHGATIEGKKPTARRERDRSGHR